MALSEWDSFYVIVGPAAGALIGLQFVVMTLMADRPTATIAEASRSFATPTVVHFVACLLLAALMRVPWPEAVFAPWAAGFVGVCGTIYMSLLMVRMRRQHAYTMDNEDRVFHVVLPWIGYVILMAAAAVAPEHFELSLFGAALSSLILLFTGIHNAWDAIAYQVLVVRNKPEDRA